MDVQRLLPSTRAERERIDVDELKAHHPIVEVVVRYGLLRRTGRTRAGVVGHPTIVVAVARRDLLRLYPGLRGSQIT